MPSPRPALFHHGAFAADPLVACKRGRSVTVCLPARDEEATIATIVRTIRHELVQRHRLVDEILVVDDGSVDRTAAVAELAGARVVRSRDVLPEYGGGPGKGQAMWKGVFEAEGDIVVFCDADIRDFDAHFVVGLLGPLLMTDGVELCKAFYERPLHDEEAGGGRVTELMARPLLRLLFPALAHVRQPLAGEYAGWREVFEQLPFVAGYGVDLGLLVDVATTFGAGSIAEVDLGVRRHRNRPLVQLGHQSTAILEVAMARAGRAPAHLTIDQRPPLLQVPSYRKSA